MISIWHNPRCGTSRRALALPPDAAVLGYAGRLGPNKRIERMLDLLAALLAEGRDRAWLLLAGRWEEEAYRRAVEARLQGFAGRVTLKVERARRRQQLAAAEMVVEEEAEPQHPPGPEARMMRQHEA